MSIEQSLGRRLISTKQVMARMGWSRTTLWRRVVSGDFPAPVKTSPNRTSFFEDDVDAAQAKLPQVSWAPDKIPEAPAKVKVA